MRYTDRAQALRVARYPATLSRGFRATTLLDLSRKIRPGTGPSRFPVAADYVWPPKCMPPSLCPCRRHDEVGRAIPRARSPYRRGVPSSCSPYPIRLTFGLTGAAAKLGRLCRIGALRDPVERLVERTYPCSLAVSWRLPELIHSLPFYRFGRRLL